MDSYFITDACPCVCKRTGGGFMNNVGRLLVVLGLIAMALFIAPIDAYSVETSLMMTSDTGDYIGQGLDYFYAATDGTFTAQRNYANGVSISFHTPGYTHWWYLDFAAPNDAPLTVGSYSGATRFSFQSPGEPGLDIHGDGRGCNTLTGSFEVKEITYGTGDDIVAFWATFEQHCEGWSSALRGDIRFNADAPPITTISSSSNPSSEGQPVTFTAEVLSGAGTPTGNVTFMDGSAALGTVSLSDSPATATFTTSSLSAGIHPITAAYSGDGTFGPSTSAVLDQTVEQVPPPVIALDYFPLYPGTVWEYLMNGWAPVTVTVQRNTALVRGAVTRVLRYTGGLREYYTNNSEGVRLHRQFQPHVYIQGLGYVDLAVTMIPPIPITERELVVGRTLSSSGIVRTNDLPGIGVLTLPYTSDATVETLEDVTVPAGNFAAVRVRVNLTIQGEAQAMTYYLAEGYGPVKVVDNDSDALELTSYTPGTHGQILSPNTGEVLHSGQPYTISWEASPDLVSFKVFYSPDNGLSWISLTPVPIGGSSLAWDVPTPKTNLKNCLMKVVGYDASGAKLWTKKSGAFTIEAVTITSPTSADALSAGTPHTIIWTSFGPAATADSFKLLYTKNNGITWTEIHKPVPGEGNPGNYLWDSIPAVNVPKTNSRVKLILKDAAGKTIGRALSDFFTIQ